jgi:hypothetical protein
MLTLITHGFIELVVNALIDDTCKNGKKITDNKRDFPHSTKLLLLNESGVLSDHHFRLLNWFRKLRNDFAHDPFFKLTPERLDIFEDIKFHDPIHFFELCVNILLSVWREHSTKVGAKFLPSYYEQVEEPVLMVEEPAPKEFVPLKSDPKTIRRRFKD